jgi:hypothetical protein
LVYSALFLISGTALLAITFVLFQHATAGDISSYRGPDGSVYAGVGSHPVPSSAQQIIGSASSNSQQVQAQAQHLQALAAQQHTDELHQLLFYSGVALAIMAILSVVLGWIVAGRALRPLRTITSAAQDISANNLHARLALSGPDDELKHLGDTIDSLLGRLEGAFDAQRRFVANASHELRTPLTMMRTTLDVAIGKPTPPPTEVTVLATKMRKGLDKADQLLEAFLLLARMEYGSPIDDSIVLLDQTVAAGLLERRRVIADRELTVEESLADAPVRGSEVLLTHMVENLIDNAVRHNEAGGWVRIATESDRDLARLVVETGGRVLDQRDVAELVQPFRRLGAERTSSDKGVGLGLSIVSAIATTHHGTLDLQARREGGLRVAITLPLAHPAAPSEAPV